MNKPEQAFIDSISPRQDFERLIRQVEELVKGASPAVLVIDGRAASGKSSLATWLAEQFVAGLVRMDDFFLPGKMANPKRLAEPGGNLHYERFAEEVLPQLKQGQGFRYQQFNCSEQRLDTWREVKASPLTVVEGSYAMHPTFGVYYDLAIFLSCSPRTQQTRLKARNSERFEQFVEKWIPLEEAYFKAYKVRSRADFRLST